MRTVIFISLLLVIPTGIFFYVHFSSDQAIIDEIDATVVTTAPKKVQKSMPQKIFKNRCEPCHGINAQNSALSKSAIIKNWSAKQIKEALLAYKEGARDAKGMGTMMHGQASNLTLEEIESLANYITTLK